MSKPANMSELGKIVSAFTVYKFIKSFVTPFNHMPAYRLGIIDKKGNFLKKTSELKTSEEKEAGNMFNRLIINLKKIIDKVPDPTLKAKLKIFTTALVLIKEDVDELGGDGDLVLQEIKSYLIKNKIDIESIIKDGEND